jgi:hypothetical protein
MAKNMVLENSTGLALALKIPKMINMSSTIKDSGGEVYRMVKECIKKSMEIFLSVLSKMD